MIENFHITCYQIVEVVVVELLVERQEGGFQLGEVHDPAGVRIRLAGNMQLDPEGMPVQARAFVPLRDVGQPVRGLQSEALEDVHARILLNAPPFQRGGGAVQSSSSIAITIASSRPSWAG